MDHLLEMICASVARHPEKPAVIQLSTEKPRVISYGGLYAGACRTAREHCPTADRGIVRNVRTVIQVMDNHRVPLPFA